MDTNLITVVDEYNAIDNDIKKDITNENNDIMIEQQNMSYNKFKSYCNKKICVILFSMFVIVSFIVIRVQYSKYINNYVDMIFFFLMFAVVCLYCLCIVC